MYRRTFLQTGVAFAGLIACRSTAQRTAGATFNPLDPAFGAVAGGTSGDAARDLIAAQRNQKAFQACADAFAHAVRQGDRAATFVFPRGDFLICAVPRPGANWIRQTKAAADWSRHAIVFDAGILNGGSATGGRIVGEGGRVKRVENEPLAFGGEPDSNNSTILVIGKWRGLSFTGEVQLEGYQVSSQAEHVRGRTSGDGWQFSFGVQDFSAEHLMGNKGTNAAFSINMNKRRIGRGGQPAPGFEMADEWVCQGFDIKRVTSINGEHGGLVNSARNVTIGSMDVSQAPYTFGGQPQQSYQQRGLYLLNADKFRADTVTISGVHHVSLFCAIYGADRTAGDLDAAIGSLVVNAPKMQDSDPDIYTAVSMQNTNSADAGVRQGSLVIGKLTTRGVRTGFLWTDSLSDEGRAWIAEDVPVLKRLEIGQLDVDATFHGVSIRPVGGAGTIVIGGGRIKVAENPAYSSATPIDGIVIDAVSVSQRARAMAAPVAMQDALARVRNAGAKKPVKPGAVVHVGDGPGGGQTMIYDPAGQKNGALGGWRPMREPRPIASCTVKLASVDSETAAGNFGGITHLSILGTAFTGRPSAKGAQDSVVTIENCGRDTVKFSQSSKG